MLVRKATEGDRAKIEAMVRSHPDTLQQDMRPAIEDYLVVKLSGLILGCCALKVHSKKLAEIWSLAYPSQWWGKYIAQLLVRYCVSLAAQEKIYQLLIINGDYEFFGRLGFRAFNEEKYALLKSMSSAIACRIAPPPGVIIREACEGDEQAIISLMALYPKQLVQSKALRPNAKDFCVAVVNGEVVGCCALDEYSGELAEIRSLVVRPDFTGKKLSHWLVAYCINRAIVRGVVELLAITNAGIGKVLFEGQFGFSTLRGAQYTLLMVLKNGNGGTE